MKAHMSIDVMIRVWDRSQHEGSHLLALLALADWANADGLCWPKVAKLAKRARVAERQAQYILAELAESGELYIQRGTGRGHGSRYVVLTGMEEATIAAVLIHHFDMPALEAQAIAREKVQQSSPFIQASNGQAHVRAERVQQSSPIQALKGAVQRRERVQSGALKGAVQRRERVQSGAKTQAVQGIPMPHSDPDPNVNPNIKEPSVNRKQKAPANGRSADGFLKLKTMGFTEDQAALYSSQLLAGDIELLGAWVDCHRHGEDGVKNPIAVACARLDRNELPFMSGDDPDELAAEQRKRDEGAKAREAARFALPPAEPPPPVIPIPENVVDPAEFRAALLRMREAS